MPSELASRQHAAGREGAHGLRVDLEELGKLLGREHLRRARVPPETEPLARDVERPQRLRDDVLLRPPELDRGTAQLLGLGGRQADEQRLSRYLDIWMISSP